MDSPDSVDQVPSRGKLSLTRLTFEWIIEDFGSIDELRLQSPLIVAGPDAKYRFKFKLYNGSFDEGTRDYVSLFLQPLAKLPFRAHLLLCLINCRGEKVEAHDSCGVVVLTKSIKWGFRCFLRRSRLLRAQSPLLPRGALRILCEVTCGGSLQPQAAGTPPPAAPLQTLGQYERLLASGDFSDATLLSSDGQVFRAHRCVLAASSPAFAELLRAGEPELVLASVDAEVLAELLLFVYAGRVEQLDRLAGELLLAAHEYGLEGLREMCAASLCEGLSPENAVERLALAHRLGEETLKARSVEFVVSHGREFARGTELRRIAELDDDVLTDVLRVLLTRD